MRIWSSFSHCLCWHFRFIFTLVLLLTTWQQNRRKDDIITEVERGFRGKMEKREDIGQWRLSPCPNQLLCTSVTEAHSSVTIHNETKFKLRTPLTAFFAILIFILRLWQRWPTFTVLLFVTRHELETLTCSLSCPPAHAQYPSEVLILCWTRGRPLFVRQQSGRARQGGHSR